MSLLPQLDTSTYLSQIFWLVISFSILYYSISRYVLPNVKVVLKNRKEYLSELDKNIRRCKKSIEKYNNDIENMTVEQQKIIVQQADQVEMKSQQYQQKQMNLAHTNLMEYQKKCQAKYQTSINQVKILNEEKQKIKSYIKQSLLN